MTEKTSLINLPISCPFKLGCSHTKGDSFVSVSEFFVHLKDDHKVVIFQLFQVAAFLDKYLRYYSNHSSDLIRGQFFTKDGITHIGCDINNPNKLSDTHVRFDLERSLLLELLQIQKIELSTSLPDKECFLCNTAISGDGLIPSYVSHLELLHGLVLGKIYNLIYIHEFISVLRHRFLEEKCCFFCKRIFSSILEIKDHMQTRNHFRIDPYDCTFDKYYIINYQV